MEQSSVLAQASDLIKAGQKQQAIEILSRLIQEDRGNVPAWGLMAMALDDPEKRRKCLQEVERIGDERMVAWARHQLAQLPPAAPPQPAALGVETLRPPAPRPIPASPPPAATGVETLRPPAGPTPTPPPSPESSRPVMPYVVGGIVLLIVACVILVLALSAPAIQRFLEAATPPARSTSTHVPATRAPVRKPRNTPTITSTPLPTKTRVPRATVTPTATRTPTPTLTPTGTLTTAEAHVGAGKALDSPGWPR